MKENLVVVRAGDKSLHAQWLSGSRNWDIAVSYFGNNPNPYEGQFDVIHRFKGSKWEGIHDFFSKNPDLIRSYKKIWLPDDDLLISASEINDFFDSTEKAGFSLSQPALSIGSYFSHNITLKNAGCEWRETNFVEVMAPCFDQKFFELVFPYFSENSSGWGLEWLWADIARKNNLKIGIIDSTAMIHTRKVGSAGHGTSASPYVEMKSLIEKYKLTMEPPRVLKKKAKPGAADFLVSTFISPFSSVFFRAANKLFK